MEIKCEFKSLCWDGSGYLHTCSVESEKIVSKFQAIKEFKGVHENGENNGDVKGIYLFYCKMECFPRDLHKHFPNLTHLMIYNCGLREISIHDLIGLENLVHLDLSNNQLTTLPDNLFRKMPSLTKILFDGNPLEFASSKLLEPFARRSSRRSNVVVDLGMNNTTYALYRSHSVRSLDELMKTIDAKCKKPPVTGYIDNGCDDFKPKLKELWTSGSYSDLKIIADTKQFKVHKNILGIQSSVFKEIFADQREATEMKITDFSSNTVEALLSFLYTGEVYEDENAKENFLIAGKFKIEKMKSVYEKIVIDQLNAVNAFDMFTFAHRYSAEDLKKKAFAKIAIMLCEDLPAELMEKPESLKRLIDIRMDFEKVLEEAKC